MSKDNEKIRVGLSRFGDIVFDTLTRLLQEGDGQEGGGGIRLFGAGGGGGRPEVAGINYGPSKRGWKVGC